MPDEPEALDERAIPEEDRINGPGGDPTDGGDLLAEDLAIEDGWDE